MTEIKELFHEITCCLTMCILIFCFVVIVVVLMQ